MRNALQRAGRIDILINNAGQIEPIALIGDTKTEAWLRALAVNLGGAYSAIHACLPTLIETRGVVINLSSGAAHVPRQGWSAYCSSKAALAMLTHCLDHEYAAQGVAAYGLQPGIVDTEMQQRIRASGMNEISKIPQNTLAPPEKAAWVLAWLADRRPPDLAGKDLSIGDATLLSRVGQDAFTCPLES
jgi:3-oxoacyl-[acyl-carrier protein] reductase